MSDCVLGVSSSIVDGSPCVCQRFYAQGRGFTLPITAICTLCSVVPRGLCPVPCKWKRALNLSAFLSRSQPSDSAPGRLSTTTWTEGNSGVSDRLLMGPGAASLGSRLRRASRCHRAYLPQPRPGRCGRSLRCLPPTLTLNPEQLTEVSQRRTRFTRTNPASVN